MKAYSVRKFKGDTILDHLLYHRGILKTDDRESFLNPSYDLGLHDPFLLTGMKMAVERIGEAIKKNEKIMIFSDYDADGIPGAVVLTDFFKMIGYKNIGLYIPHRHNEGFGLNIDAIKSIAKDTEINQKILLITIDCGITDVEEVALANSLGMNVIITDHHESGPTLPDAYAIVNPKISPDYPDKMICGSGVVFKLIQGMLKVDRRDVSEGKEKWLLDMVGIATLSDMVPLRNENRVFAHYGLKVLQKSPRVGLKKLLTTLKINQKNLTEDDVGFMITPRINVASRMGDPIDAFRLLSTEDEKEADDLVEKLNALNDERKIAVALIIKEIKSKEYARGLADQNKKVIVLGNPSWRPAVLGLVANNLMKEYGKPVFLWGRSASAKTGGPDILKGSCRSEGQTDLVALMHGVDDGIFIDRGGHKMAGGFSLLTENAHLLGPALEKSLEKISDLINKDIVEDDHQTFLVDHILGIDDITFPVWDTVEKLAPFGIDNEKPTFLFKSVKPTLVKRFGKKNEHIELVFTKQDGRKVSAISFFAVDNPLFEQGSFDLVATLEKSMFRNYPELRLRIVDIQ